SFFQAEDGIRDATVTGVQTCALPISPPGSAPVRGSPSRHTKSGRETGFRASSQSGSSGAVPPELHHEAAPKCGRKNSPRGPPRQIGRASCRERVEITEGGGGCEKTQE